MYYNETDDAADAAAPNGPQEKLAVADLAGRADLAARNGRLGGGEHSSAIYGLAWSPNSAQLASGSADGTAHVWRAQ